MGERHRVGADTVAQMWKSRNLRPGQVEMFKLSAGPNFETKLVDLVDVVGVSGSA